MIVGENALESLISKKEKALHLFRVKVTAYFLATPLVLSFSAVDYFFAPHLWKEFLAIRLTIIPISLLVAILFRFGNSLMERFYWIPSAIILLHLGIYSAYLCAKTGGSSSPYYAGLNLTIMGASVYLPWRTRHLVMAFAIVFGPFLIHSFFLQNSIDWSHTIPNLAFMGSTAFMCAILHKLTHDLRKKEIMFEKDLKEEILNKEIIIAQKTKEGVELERLASQFSPQVVRAIKGGNLQLGDKRRQEITCIFIDLENSTRRASRIDHSDYDKLVSDFFTRCIEVLLEHDVTIGTFLGDGLLAFSNAPLPSKDHSKKAFQACLEILRHQKKISKLYSNKWRTEFNIRVGIHTGFANCGFYPNDKIGTYTAMGESVSLTSRLCSYAKANHLCATKTFLTSCAPYLKDVNVLSEGMVDTLKGFEGEQFELFSLAPNEAAQAEMSPDCPLCEGHLVQQDDLGDAVLLKCNRCGYHDLVSKLIAA